MPLSLIGRSRELARLRDGLADAALARTRLHLLVGEPGIGKTTLADTICREAAQQSFVVCWGRCWEAGSAPAYWPWAQIVRGLARAIPSLDAGPVAELTGATVHETSERAVDARFRLFDAVTTFVREAATQRPLVLVVDDLHVVDEPSARLLHFLARELRDAPLLLLVTYRDRDLRARGDLAAIVDSVAREGERLELQRFERAEIAAFLADRAPARADEATVSAVTAATEGNPLCLDETVRWLSAQPAEAPVRVPDGVRHAIAGNLERLDEGTRSTLAIAAVIGREVPLGLLSSVLSRVAAPRIALGEVLANAARVGAITVDGARFVFTHILVRQSLYEELAPGRRAAIHREVALALEGVEPATAATTSAIAHHYAEAGPASAAAAIEHGLRAAQHALDSLAAEDALQRFVDLLARIDAAHASDRLRGEALLGVASSHIALGQLDAARAVIADVAELARSGSLPELLARAALVLGSDLRTGSIDGALLALLEEALAALPPGDSVLRARVTARYAAAKQPNVDTGLPPRIAREAIAMARRTRDLSTLAYALYFGRASFMPRGHLEERIAIDVEARELADLVGDRSMARLAHARLACERLEQRDLGAALVHVDCLEAYAGSSSPRERWRAPLLRAMFAVLHGEFRRADELASAARALVTTRDANADVAFTMHHLGRLRAQHRNRDYIAAARSANGGGETQSFRSLQQTLMMLGASAQARDVDTARAMYAAMPRTIPDGAAGVSSISEGAALVAPLDDIARYYDVLLEQADTIDVWGTLAFNATGSMHRCLGVLATRLGRFDTAFDHFRLGVAHNNEVRAIPWVAETEFLHGEALIARDHGTISDEARLHLQRARDIAAALEMDGLVERIDGVANRSSPPVEVISRRVDLRSAFVDEGDVWAITWEGATFRVKGARGFRLLVHLLDRPDTEVHVLELASLLDSGGATTMQEGSLPALDAKAKAAYGARLRELAADLAEAESHADRGRSERIRRELDAVTDELASAVGLGGRDRQQGSSAERARVRVQKRLADAIKRIEAHAPGLARLLTRSVKTGTFCAFRP